MSSEQKEEIDWNAPEPDAFGGSALLETERLYSALIDAPMAISIYRGPELRVEFVNRIFIQIAGVGREILGRRFQEAFPAVRPQIFSIHEEVFRTGKPFHADELSAILDYERNGRPYERVWTLSCQPVRGRDGSIEGVFTCSYDVTGLVRARRQAEQSRRTLRLIADSVPIHLLQLDREERFQFANKAAADLWAREPEQMVGKSIREVIGPDAQATLKGFTERTLAGETVSYERPFLTPDGQTRTFLNTYSPYRGAGGAIQGFIATGTDITDRKNAEAALHNEREKLRVIFEKSPAAMALWRGPDMVFEMVNPTYQAIFPGRELLGKRFLDALPEFEGQPFLDLLRRVLETGEPYVGHEVLARHRTTEDGPIEDRYYDFVYVRVEDGEGRPYGVYDHAVDVTDRVRSRLRMEKTVSELEQERILRERFVATLTHDLRTPLTAAKLSAQLLGRKAAKEPAVQLVAARISGHIDRADAMIRDLLDASLINVGESLPMDIEACDLNQLVQETLADLGAIHGDRFVLLSAPAIRGHWSCSGLRRVLENLCSNAIKYGATHAPVMVGLAEEDERVVITVHNEGPAIARAEQEKLFEPFHRSTSAVTGGQKGWGLGLTLVKGIAEAHGGSVRLERSDESGTTFSVQLPLHAVPR